MTKVVVRVHPVHLMNVHWAPGGRQASEQANRFGLWHAHPFSGPFSGTTRVSQYQKVKTNLDFTEARDSEWKWHQLGHMQVCTSLQTDNHASTPPLSFFTGRMPFLPLPILKHELPQFVIFRIKLAAYSEHDKSQTETGCKRIWLAVDTVLRLRTWRPTYTFHTHAHTLSLQSHFKDTTGQVKWKITSKACRMI